MCDKTTVPVPSKEITLIEILSPTQHKVVNLLHMHRKLQDATESGKSG